MGNGKKYFETDETDEILSAEILDFSHEYQSNDFPNPAREGCPPNEELLKIAASDQLPEADLREHLLNCSPCFQEFHAARQSKFAVPAVSKPEPAKQENGWRGFFLRPLPIAALLLALGVAALIVLYNLPDRNGPDVAGRKDAAEPAPVSQNPPVRPRETDLPAQNTPPSAQQNKDAIDSAPAPKPNNSTPNLKNEDPKTAPETADDAKLTARNPVKLDLAKAAVMRNGTAVEKVYSLAPQTVALDVKLPADSPAGNYEVALLDEFGKPLLKSLTAKSDGKNLKININLQNKRGRARLCIAPTGEIPDCFAVTIGPAQ